MSISMYENPLFISISIYKIASEYSRCCNPDRISYLILLYRYFIICPPPHFPSQPNLPQAPGCLELCSSSLLQPPVRSLAQKNKQNFQERMKKKKNRNPSASQSVRSYVWCSREKLENHLQKSFSSIRLSPPITSTHDQALILLSVAVKC